MKNNRHKADTELVRQQNRSLVLEALRKYSTLASIELGEKTRLSPATISAITNDMLSERLIEADKEGAVKIQNAQRGRPKVKLTLAPLAAAIIGVHISHNTITILLADFCGTMRARKSIEVDTNALSSEAFSSVLTDEVLIFLDEQNIKAKHVSIISVACQGSVDAGKGEIIWSPAFSARGIKIARPLADALNAPCIVANDTNAIAHLLHVEDDEMDSSFAVLYLGSGIGLGLYVNDAILEGAEGSASEFGHMVWRKNGALCRCGRKGCIEAYASDFGIYRSCYANLADKLPADISPTADEMEKLADAARKGDKDAAAAFKTAGAAIGDGLSHLTMLINPRSIKLTGPGVTHFDLLKAPIEEALQHAKYGGCEAKLEIINDNRNLIEKGLLALAFTRLDREIFARRVSVADVASRHSHTSDDVRA